MTQTVSIPGIGDIDFPDGMSHEQIASAIQQNFPQIHQKESPYAKGAQSMLEGFRAGGLPGAILSGAGAGLNTLSEVIDKTAYTAGDKAAEAATALGAKPETAGMVGAGVNTAIQAAPAMFGGEAAKSFSPALKDVGRTLMQSAVKPQRKMLDTGKADQAIEFLLQNKIPATESGKNFLLDRINTLQKEIDFRLKGSKEVVNKNAVAAKLNETFDKLRTDLKASENNEAIMRTFDEFLNHPLLKGTDEIPVELANQFKTSLYKRLTDAKYGMGVRNSAEELAQKTLARSLKENIERRVPEVSPLLAEQSQLINALKNISPRLAIEGNKNPVGLGLLAHNPYTFLAWEAERSPFIKSGLAGLLYRGSEQIPANLVRTFGALPMINQ